MAGFKFGQVRERGANCPDLNVHAPDTSGGRLAAGTRQIGGAEGWLQIEKPLPMHKCQRVMF